MKQKSLLLLALSLVLLQSCLGAPKVTESAPNGQTATPPTEALPSSTPQPTPLPSHIVQLRVAYILAGNVWVWDASTGARQLTSDGDAWRAKISDDGQVIVFQTLGNINSESSSENAGDTLWAVNADGSDSRILVNIPRYATFLQMNHQVNYFFTDLYQFEIQPNSHWVYFTTAWDADQGQMPSDDLHKVDADHPTPEPLLSRSCGEISFSPDGTLISLASIGDIDVVNSDGVGLTLVPDGASSWPVVSFNLRFTNQQTYHPQVVWLSNGTGIYAVLPFRNDSCSQYLGSGDLAPDETGKRFCLAYIASDGSAFAQLAEFSAEWTETGQPLISPDGTKVAYVVKNNSTYELHVIDAATIDTVIASYENPPMFELYGWSPDSKRVVFFISDRLFPFAAGIGLPPAPLTESAAPYSLRWLDAERFLFFREGRLLVGQVGSSATFEIAAGFDKLMDNFNFYDFVLLPSP
ncbi:MAG: hypothetical protein HY867_02850 [Chloroflexi bacterium]|nr:hypothetical protein [Chloroflexota bacterium]